MNFLIPLPVIFICIAILVVCEFAKMKLLKKIVRIILILAIIYFAIEYINYIGFDIKDIF